MPSKKSTKPALSLDQWCDHMATLGNFWRSSEAKEALGDWYWYKEERGELYTSPRQLTAISRLFKGQEYLFPVSVSYQLTKGNPKDLAQGIFPVEWLGKNLQAQQSDQRKAEALARLRGDR